LKEAVNWVIGNREWLFSGVGLAILAWTWVLHGAPAGHRSAFKKEAIRPRVDRDRQRLDSYGPLEDRLP
jgi:hypothetical protein